METSIKLTVPFIAALKADKKRLKAEKFDLLNQMKQLYATLEDKEKELRDFIRNYEQVLLKKVHNLAMLKRHNIMKVILNFLFWPSIVLSVSQFI